jgi:hypothetical protein
MRAATERSSSLSLPCTCRAQAVHGIVRDGDRFFDRVVRKDREDRPKDFLLRNRHVGADIREDRRACVKALAESGGSSSATRNQVRAFIDACLDDPLHPAELRAIGERAVGRRFGERVADDHLFGRRKGQRFDLDRDIARHDHAGRRAARLAHVPERGGDAERDGSRQIGVR